MALVRVNLMISMPYKVYTGSVRMGWGMCWCQHFILYYTFSYLFVKRIKFSAYISSKISDRGGEITKISINLFKQNQITMCAVPHFFPANNTISCCIVYTAPLVPSLSLLSWPCVQCNALSQSSCYPLNYTCTQGSRREH